MRIILDNCPTVTIDSGTIYGKQFAGAPMTFYGEPDTIEITDKEWDEIYETYPYWPAMNDPIWEDNRPVNFAEYLRELLELKRGGL